MRAQVRHELASTIADLLNSSANNSELASVIRRTGLGEQLTADEQFQFRLRSNALLRYWEDVHYQYRLSFDDEVKYSRQKAAWKAPFAWSIGFVNYWCEVRTLYSPLFASEIDGLLPPQKLPAISVSVTRERPNKSRKPSTLWACNCLARKSFS
jgi:hypothetical protein